MILYQFKDNLLSITGRAEEFLFISASELLASDVAAQRRENFHKGPFEGRNRADVSRLKYYTIQTPLP